MAISSKEIVIILLTIISPILLGLFIKNIDFNIDRLKESITTGIIIIIATSTVIIIFYKKIKEVNKELENIKTEQTKLDEKLKIYKRLAKIEEKIGI